VTAKTADGKVFYKNEKIYMPVPQQMGRGDKMGRGPYEKSGILRDTSLPPLKTTREKFTIPVYTEATKDDKLVRTIMPTTSPSMSRYGISRTARRMIRATPRSGLPSPRTCTSRRAGSNLLLAA